MLPLTPFNPVSGNDSILPFANQTASIGFDTMPPFPSSQPAAAPINPLVLTPAPSTPLAEIEEPHE